jgi:hypothetical protein
LASYLSFGEVIKDTRRKKVFSITLCFFVVFLILPTALAGLYYFRESGTNLTNAVLEQRQVLADLSASSVKVRLDSLGGIAKSFAGAEALQTLVRKGNWHGAILAAEDLSNQSSFYDPFIDRIVLVDSMGTIQAAYPELHGSIGEQDVGFQEWEKPLLGGEAFYVTNVYKRLAMPRINVVKVVAPVRTAEKIYGFVLLQIPVNNFSDLGKYVDVGRDGFAYFFDRLGHIITHPKFSSDGPVVDYSSVPAVNKAIHGGHGVEVLYNPIEQQERVSAYEQVPGYGWGVVAQEPATEAFVNRNGILLGIALLTVILCFAELCIAVLVWGLIDKFITNGKFEKK